MLVPRIFFILLFWIVPDMVCKYLLITNLLVEIVDEAQRSIVFDNNSASPYVCPSICVCFVSQQAIYEPLRGHHMSSKAPDWLTLFMSKNLRLRCKRLVGESRDQHLRTQRLLISSLYGHVSKIWLRSTLNTSSYPLC